MSDRERAKKYRDRKRDASVTETSVLGEGTVTVFPDNRHTSVTPDRTWGNVYPKQPEGTIERVEGASGYYWKDGLKLPRPFIPNWEQEGLGDPVAHLKAIAEALDKSVQGLDGKVDLGDMVRYGVHGPTLTELGRVL